MATYENTGYYRMKTINVKKYTDGSETEDVNYDITDAFSYGGNDYLALTDTELKQLSDALYNTRLGDFKLYIESLHSGLSVDAVEQNSSTGYNETLCPKS